MKSDKPIILITAQHANSGEENSQMEGARKPYLESIIEAGGIPLILPYSTLLSDLSSVLSVVDGVLLTGGADIDPDVYGETRLPECGSAMPERDKIEIALAKICYERDIPTLGICRGLQVINVALGGTLWQDLPSQVGGEELHRNKEWLALPHLVKISLNSSLREILRTAEIAVNSLHHQAIRQLTPKLIDCATSPAGIIEGIEAPDKEFFVAVQWHPEVLWQESSPVMLELFRWLVKKARNN